MAQAESAALRRAYTVMRQIRVAVAVCKTAAFGLSGFKSLRDDLYGPVAQLVRAIDL